MSDQLREENVNMSEHNLACKPGRIIAPLSPPPVESFFVFAAYLTPHLTQKHTLLFNLIPEVYRSNEIEVINSSLWSKSL